MEEKRAKEELFPIFFKKKLPILESKRHRSFSQKVPTRFSYLDVTVLGGLVKKIFKTWAWLYWEMGVKRAKNRQRIKITSHIVRRGPGKYCECLSRQIDLNEKVAV